MKNEGFDPQEIAELKAECQQEGQNYVIVEDEDGMNDSGEFAHFQFVGKHNGQEVIYDAVMGTLRLNHSSLVFEEAENRMKKSYPDYIEVDKRKPNYKVNKDMELMLEEIIEELEEEEVIQVAETLEIDEDFEYGIGLDIALNVEEIDSEVITKFVNEFNAGTLKLDPTLYSFMSEEE
ncbi:hypothetical protein [Emticicia sp. C21]|uniref:hypothetical protein n=1 Tax=Emticicia sp. C21 TaxID=2302915 RepID=UPI000E354D67|nr:hypothetical protein [Emticicia sp. C21]RFS14777.1 hypothetical protein D0T08_19130 [Emticicia sp. C21]